MTSYAAKLGAIVAAGALLATAAIPAYASTGSGAAVTHRSASVQTVSLSSTVALAAPSRDGYSVTAKPVPVVVAATNVTGTAGTARTAGNASKYDAALINPPAQSYSGSAVLAYAQQFVGVVPYGMGNNPADSFSCDGYTQYVFAAFGISLPRTANAQAALGVRINQADAVAGDLVFWPGRHVGIYDGAGGMYNSPTWGRYVEHASSLWGAPLFIRLRV